MARLDFAAKFKKRQVDSLKSFFNRAIRAVKEVFGRHKIEDYILKIHKERFDAIGENVWAQRDPNRRPWRRIRPSTLKRRKRNKNDRQALVDTGALRRAVRVTRDDLNNVLTVGRGRAAIGIPVTSSQYDKGVKMQEGYKKRARGGREIVIPARPFIGLGPLDIKAVDRFVDRVFARVR